MTLTGEASAHARLSLHRRITACPLPVHGQSVVNGRLRGASGYRVGLHPRGRLQSICGAILTGERPRSLLGHGRLNVVMGIDNLVTNTAVANLYQDYVLLGFVD
ncbi:MAG: hypothetical protein ACI8PT_001367 [Gammaproteobacteria bacterium]|jgi:hypothetical protein